MKTISKVTVNGKTIIETDNYTEAVRVARIKAAELKTAVFVNTINADHPTAVKEEYFTTRSRTVKGWSSLHITEEK